MHGKIFGVILIFMMVASGLWGVAYRKIDQKDVLDQKATKLAHMILRAIKHEIHISQQNGAAVAYGKIVLSKQPANEFHIRAGSSNKIYVGYEVVSGSTPSNPSAGNTRVYGIVGTYILKDDGSKVFKPLSGVKVEAWDSDGDTTQDYLTSTTTDSSGYFEMTFSSEDGWLGAYGTQDVYLKFFLDTSYAVIQRSGSTYWAVMTVNAGSTPDAKAISIYLDDDNGDGTYNGVGASGDGSAGGGSEAKWVYASNGWIVRYILEEGFHARDISVPSTLGNPDPAGAAMILWYIQQAYNFMKSKVGITPPKLTVEFSNSESSTHYDPNSNELIVSGYSNQYDWEDMTLVLKEYAKFLLKQYTTLTVTTNGFSWTSHKDNHTAWIEGFGAYFGSAVKDWSGLGRIYKDRPSYSYDPETQYDTDGVRNDYDIAGAVAGILWDYYDSTNDDQNADGIGDRYSIPFSYIWNTIDYDNPSDIVEFYYKLRNRYSVNKMYSWEIYWEHGINLDHTPPTAPTITSKDPSTTSWVKQNYIYIQWSASSDDMSGIKYYKVYLTKDGSSYNTYTTTGTSINMTNLPTGTYYVTVRAYDRAGNYADSSQAGPFKLDTSAPIASGAAPTGTIYDNKTDSIVLTITWTDQGSGVSAVYFRYRYSSTSYGSWLSPTSSSENTYYYSISVSEWKQHIGEYLYWESYAKDAVGNIKYSVEYSVYLADDDTSGPTISSVDTSGDVYDSAASYYIKAKVTDPSGVSNVWIIWRFSGHSWNNWTATDIGSGYWQITIDDSYWDSASLWQGTAQLTIEYYIVAKDNDNDRANDKATSQYGSASSPYTAGHISDDDTAAPQIVSRSSTGDIYDSYSYGYRIYVTLSDASGIANVTIYWSFDQSSWTATSASQYSSDTWYIEISADDWKNTPAWQGKTSITVYYYVEAWDADNDRQADAMKLTSSVYIAGTITDDDSAAPNIVPHTTGVIYDNYTGSYFINATITDDSGLSSVTIKYKIDDGSWSVDNNPKHSGDNYYEEITKSIWASPSYWSGKTNITIYYEIIATDNDNDRNGDSLTADTGVKEAGKIYDDDTSPPAVSSVSTFQQVYDNYTGSLYINVTFSDKSGISYVKFYWRFSTNSTWQPQDPDGHIGNMYYMSISESLWKAPSVWGDNTQIEVYFYVVATDNDNDRADDSLTMQSSTYDAGTIIDDDSSPPSISKVTTTGYVEDSFGEYYYINATITDASGLRVVYINWKIGNFAWHNWTANSTGDVYWIAIDRSLWGSQEYWEGKTSITIYYQIYAQDNDNDRVGDYLDTETQVNTAGTISDDDTDPPSISAVYTSGTMYDCDKKPFYINASISDNSGLSSVIISWSFNNATWNNYTAQYDSVNKVWWIGIDRGLWISTSSWDTQGYVTIYYIIYATDADSDRAKDSLSTKTNIDIAGHIYDDDTDPPSIYDVKTTGNITDAYPGAFYINVTFNDTSGIKNATIYYSFDNQTWNPRTARNAGEVWYIAIPKEEWGSADEWKNSNSITIYYYIRVYDNDTDRGEKDVKGTTFDPAEAGIITDDDTNAPSITDITFTGNGTGYVYDNYQGPIYINATITDESGLDNVTFYWRFEGENWTGWTPKNDGDVYYIAIGRDIWASRLTWNKTQIALYYEIVAWDNDKDRLNDQLKADTGEQQGPIIADDDDDPPAIQSVTYTGKDSGMLYDSYPGDIYINATVTDASGVKNVSIRWRFNDGEWHNWTATRVNGTDLYYIVITREVWSQSQYWYSTNLTIWYWIVAWDNDTDRPHDQLMTDNGVQQGPVIMDDDDEPPAIQQVTTTGIINDSYGGAFFINATVTDASGVKNVTIYWKIGLNDTWHSYVANFDGSVWWIAIDRGLWASASAWKNASQVAIYYYIVAWDNDTDRPHDQLMVNSGANGAYYEAGRIVDDDSQGPIIDDIYIIDRNRDGVLEADENFSIVVKAHDESGIRSIVVKVYGATGLLYSLELGTNLTEVSPGEFMSNSLSPLIAGNFSVVVFAEDNDNDRDMYDTATSSENTNFSVKLETLGLNVNPVNISANFSDTISISVEPVDYDSSHMLNVVPLSVKVYRNDTIAYEVSMDISIDAVKAINIPVNFSAGVWYINITVGSNKHFSEESKGAVVYVHEKTSVSLYIPTSEIVEYENATFGAKLVAEDGDALRGRNVSFYMKNNGSWVLIGWALTNSSGFAVINWNVSMADGNYVLRAVYDGEDYYYGSANSTTIKIYQSEAIIVPMVENDTWHVVYSDPASILVELYNWRTGAVIGNANISLYAFASGREIYLASGLTNASGYAYIVVPSVNLEPGEYVLLIKWGGNVDYSPTTTRLNLLIDKENIGNVDISISPSTVQYSDKVTIIIHASDDDGEAVRDANAVLEIYEGLSPIARAEIRILNGVAIYNWTVAGISEAPENLTVKLTIPEGKYYYEASTIQKFGVTKENVILNVTVKKSGSTLFVGDEARIVVTLQDDDGEAVKYIDIKVYVNDVLLKSDYITESKYEVSWVPSKEGAATIRVVVGENSSYYSSAETTVKVNVLSNKLMSSSTYITYGIAATLGIIGLAAIIKRRKKKAVGEEVQEALEEAAQEKVEDTDKTIEEQFDEMFGDL